MEKILHGDSHPPKTYVGGTISMTRKLLYSISLAGVLIVGPQILARPMHLQSDSGKQSSPATKSVAGKVTSIGNSGTSFAVEVEGASKQTMEFVVNTKTQVQGQVKIGSLVAVDYQPTDSGQNLAVTVSVRS
jgi:hypothetical protein